MTKKSILGLILLEIIILIGYRIFFHSLAIYFTFFTPFLTIIIMSRFSKEVRQFFFRKMLH